jgi:hypothetical protein
MKGSGSTRGSKMPFQRCAAAFALAASCVGGSAYADFGYNDGKVLLTEAVSMADGASGGGAVPWATIAGNETRDGINANTHYTYVYLPNYSFDSFGAAIGFFDRFEVSYAYDILPTGSTFDTVGLLTSALSGSGANTGTAGINPWNTTIKMSVFGAKIRLIGEAIYDSDNLIPQVAIGGFYKVNDDKILLETLGAKKASDFEAYAAITKIFFPISTVVDLTVRYTGANEIGLTGFGNSTGDHRKPRFEGSIGYLLAKSLVIGGEYQQHGNNLGGKSVNLDGINLTGVTSVLGAVGLGNLDAALTQLHESSWKDLFIAYAPYKNISFTGAILDFGNITLTPNQFGYYISVAASF